MNTETSIPPIKSFSLTKLIILAGFALLFGVIWQTNLLDYLSFETLREHQKWLDFQVAQNAIMVGLIFSAIYALVVALSLPGGTVMTVTGGFLFGPFVGTFCSVFGATTGAVFLFLIARYVFGDSLRARYGAMMQKMEQNFRNNAFSYMLVLRLVPLFPFVVVNLVPALLNVRLGIYALTTFFGIIPATFVYSGFGNGLGAVFDSGKELELSGILTKPEIIMPIIGLAILACIPIIYKKMRNRTTQNPEQNPGRDSIETEKLSSEHPKIT